MLPIASAVTPVAQLVVRREHPVVAMAVLPRRRDEIGDPFVEIGARATKGIQSVALREQLGRRQTLAGRLNALVADRRIRGGDDGHQP